MLIVRARLADAMRCFLSRRDPATAIGNSILSLAVLCRRAGGTHISPDFIDWHTGGWPTFPALYFAGAQRSVYERGAFVVTFLT